MTFQRSWNCPTVNILNVLLEVFAVTDTFLLQRTILRRHNVSFGLGVDKGRLVLFVGGFFLPQVDRLIIENVKLSV